MPRQVAQGTVLCAIEKTANMVAQGTVLCAIEKTANMVRLL